MSNVTIRVDAADLAFAINRWHDAEDQLQKLERERDALLALRRDIINIVGGDWAQHDEAVLDRIRNAVAATEDDPRGVMAGSWQNPTGMVAWSCPNCRFVNSPANLVCVKCVGHARVTESSDPDTLPPGMVIKAPFPGLPIQAGQPFTVNGPDGRLITQGRWDQPVTPLAEQTEEPDPAPDSFALDDVDSGSRWLANLPNTIGRTFKPGDPCPNNLAQVSEAGDTHRVWTRLADDPEAWERTNDEGNHWVWTWDQVLSAATMVIETSASATAEYPAEQVPGDE